MNTILLIAMIILCALLDINMYLEQKRWKIYEQYNDARYESLAKAIRKIWEQEDERRYKEANKNEND